VEPKAVVWHFQSMKGGMRSHTTGYNDNLEILEKKKRLWNIIDPSDLVIADIHGRGDSIVLKEVLRNIDRNCWVFTDNIDIYETDILPDHIKFLRPQDGEIYYNGNPPETIYNWMIQNNWEKSMQEAYKKMLGVENG
jgi:hypothetical protein